MTPLCVAPGMVPDIWPHVREFIEAAFAHDRGDDDAEIVHADLLSGGSLLWVAWDDERKRIIAAATSKLIKVRRGLICCITSCGGIDIDRWSSCLAAIEAYAKDEGCTLMRIEGRKGFARVFPDYTQPWIVLEKRL